MGYSEDRHNKLIVQVLFTFIGVGVGLLISEKLGFISFNPGKTI